MKICKMLGWGAAMGALSFLSFFVVACDREREAIEGAPGKMVEVHVRILGVRAGQSEEAVRAATHSSSTGRQEITSTSQAMGDGMVMDMSLELDESEPLRAATPVPLENGKTFRVIALRTSDKHYVGHADFTIVDGVSNTDASLHVPEGVSHDFICLSHNGTSLTSGLFATASYTANQEPADIQIPSASATEKDLLYAKTTATLSASNKNISFLLEHKLSKVTVVIDGKYNNYTVTVYSNRVYLYQYPNATMKLRDGSMTKGSRSLQYVNSWTTVETYTQTSAPQMIFTNGEAMDLVIMVNAANLSPLGQRPRVAKTLTFSGIVSGNSYTLRVKMYAPKWAGSNIYWNGSAMTFDPNGTTTHQGYQGLFFKYRGTMGISPVGNTFTSSTPVYRVGYSTPQTGYSWSNIYANQGDICQTLNGAYRLPKNGEFGTETWTSWTSSVDRQGWSKGGSNYRYTSDKDDGTFDLINTENGCRVTNSYMGNVTLPSSSHRGSDGSLVGLPAGLVGYSGYYWCGDGYSMSFDYNGYWPGAGVDNVTAFSVRCVVN
jgi:hypothetical protein